MGPPRYRRKAVVDLEYFIPKYFPNNNHIVHDGSLSLPKYVKDIQWHAIILGSTFLCKCTHPDEFEMTLNDYGWIKDSNAVKIALPQDDYNCSEILDISSSAPGNSSQAAYPIKDNSSEILLLILIFESILLRTFSSFK